MTIEEWAVLGYIYRESDGKVEDDLGKKAFDIAAALGLSDEVTQNACNSLVDKRLLDHPGSPGQKVQLRVVLTLLGKRAWEEHQG
jgi:DNA-binding MarR family transcriptional regulator